MTDASKTAKIIYKEVILLNSTLTVRRCDGEWYHLLMIVCCYRSVSHCVSPLTSV